MLACMFVLTKAWTGARASCCSFSRARSLATTRSTSCTMHTHCLTSVYCCPACSGDCVSLPAVTVIQNLCEQPRGVSTDSQNTAVSRDAKHRAVSTNAKHRTVRTDFKHREVSTVSKHRAVSRDAKHGAANTNAKHRAVSTDAKMVMRWFNQAYRLRIQGMHESVWEGKPTMFCPCRPATRSWGRGDAACTSAAGSAPGPTPSPGWAAWVRMTCSQLWPLVVRMGVAVRRCSQLLWGRPGPILTPPTPTQPVFLPLTTRHTPGCYQAIHLWGHPSPILTPPIPTQPVLLSLSEDGIHRLRSVCRPAGGLMTGNGE